MVSVYSHFKNKFDTENCSTHTYETCVSEVVDKFNNIRGNIYKTVYINKEQVINTFYKYDICVI